MKSKLNSDLPIVFKLMAKWKPLIEFWNSTFAALFLNSLAFVWNIYTGLTIGTIPPIKELPNIRHFSLFEAAFHLHCINSFLVKLC